MAAASSQSKLLHIHYRLPPSPPSSPSISSSRPCPRRQPWAWEEGEKWRRRRKNGTVALRARCAPLQPSQAHPRHQGGGQIAEENGDDTGIMCEPCNARGWLLCDFCKGQKTNVKAKNNRIYRRCPSCRAVGHVLCAQCKVFKCVTFPGYDDGEMRDR